ncbi:UBA-like domain-containing protein 2-A [Trichinella spiralis]|uniref:UBA-like domain-containing protein 2-A n=1 Tax=Trichinella spiralis TaxID=6334 RepID=A0ABR3KEK3_TRISP
MVDRGSVDDLTINLRQQLMVNQFQTATGCSHDQAEQLLLSSRWQFQPALSLFFEEYNPSINTSNSSCPSATVDKLKTDLTDWLLGENCFSCTIKLAYAPCNTPVTPPSLSETMMAFQQLHAIDDWMSRSPPSSVCFASSSHSSPMSGFTPLTPTFIQSSGLRSANNDVGFSFAGQAVTGNGDGDGAGGGAGNTSTRNIDRWTPAEFGSNLNMPNESSFSDGQSGTGAAKFAQFQ